MPIPSLNLSPRKNMPQITKSNTYLSLTYLIILCLILIPSPSSSSSSSNDQQFQLLNVSASLRLTRQVFSPSTSIPRPLQGPRPPLSLTLHSLSSLPGFLSTAANNYTTLTLSRLARDQARVRSLLLTHSLSLSTHLQSPLISGVQQGTGEYLTRIGVGRPAEPFYLSIDTGSDVTWLQCLPCLSCYPQSDPIFNPAASATYQPLSCASRQCAALDASACSGRRDCLYEVRYGDGSSTIGNFATDTISFSSSAYIANVAIGCGHDNEGLFLGSAGLLGLGGGSLSLPSQISATSFSYCLVNRDSRSSSTLDFNSAEPADSVVAPMLTNPRIATFYYVGLTGISVGGRPVRIRDSQFIIDRRGRGGVIVDSGTAVTRFPMPVYRAVRNAFRDSARNLRFAGGFSLMDTCYDLSGQSSVMVPTMSFQFAGGDTLPLRPYNYLIPVDSEGKHCFAFAGTEASMSIIGNIQQQETRVSYNLVDRSIGFSPNKC